jgi:hypothetical protein
MYCPECGHHNRDAARFCGRCGASLLEPGEAETTMSFTPPAEVGADTGVMEAVTEGPTLVIRLGAGRTGDYYSVGGARTTIGREPDSDVFLDDVTVSREHALLERKPDGVHLRDLNSLNGTYVNRERVEDIRLADGDELQVGKYRLTFIDR